LQQYCDQYSKDTIWKQFTTDNLIKSTPVELWPIFQRYNLKAIHNAVFIFCLIYRTVTNIPKIQFESNSQHRLVDNAVCSYCDQYSKDTIWKQFTTFLASPFLLTALWPIFQRYNLKAIHNTMLFFNSCWITVTNIPKIQFESNSQQF